MSWTRTDLASIVSVLESGARPTGGASTESGEIPSLGGENILSSGGVTLDGVKRVPVEFYKRMNKGHLNDEDVLINKDGAQTGKVGLYRNLNGSPSCINEHLFLIRGESEKISQQYLYYTLLSQPGQLQIAAQISGSAQPGLKSDFLHGVFGSIPNALSEQTKITEILSTVDQAIDETEAVIAKQERIKIGLMQDLLTRGIDEHGSIRSEHTHKFKESPLGRIPVEWEIGRLEELTEKIVDGVHRTPVYLDTGIPFVVVTDLTKGTELCFSNTRSISEDDHREFIKRADPRPGDVMVTKDGTLGVARVVDESAPPFSILVSVAMLRPRTELCSPELIWSFFESGHFLRQLGALSAGTGLAHIHLEHFREFLIKRPTIKEQRIIFSVITEHRLSLQQELLRREKLQSLKTALMQDLLTGAVSVSPLLTEAEVGA